MEHSNMGGESVLHSSESNPTHTYSQAMYNNNLPSYQQAGSIHPSSVSSTDHKPFTELNQTVACLICYNPRVNILLEPCHHQFHIQCVDRWLNKDKVCPVCWIPIQNHRPIQTSYPSTVPAPSSSSSPLQQRSTTPSPRILVGSASSGILPAQATANMEHSNPSTTVRKGKWTSEETAYCDRLIEEFKHGNLPLAEGTTLRTFLSKLLNCDPMRISKKYTGDMCIGKIIFRRREEALSPEAMERIRSELAELEKTYLEREQYNQRRREKRLESELSRDKNRFIASRTVTSPMHLMPPHSTSSSSYHHHHHQQQQQTLRPNPMAALQEQQMMVHAQARAQAQAQAEAQVLCAQQSHAYGNGSEEHRTTEPPPPSNPPPSTTDPKTNDSISRVSSIDSFGSFFPRVASIDGFDTSHQLASYGCSENGGGMIKSLSIGDGLSAFFPRIQSLENLSNLLHGPSPSSPKQGRRSGEEEESSPKPLKEDDEEENNPVRDDASDSKGDKTSPTQLKTQMKMASGIFPRVSSMDKLPRIPSMDKLSSLAETTLKVPRVPSSNDMLRLSDSMSSFPSFSNLSGLSTCASFEKLNTLASSSSLPTHGGVASGINSQHGAFRPGFPRNSSIEDILSLVASSESEMPSHPSKLQLSALAAVAGEESSLRHQKKRRIESESTKTSAGPPVDRRQEPFSSVDKKVKYEYEEIDIQPTTHM